MSKAAGEPVYQTIISDLRRQIIRNHLKPGEMIPSENELSARYQTTRATVRRGLQVLENQGFIHSWPGKGYYVSQPRHNIFTFEFPEDEWSGTVAYKNADIIHATPELCREMELDSSACVLRICRVIRNEKRVTAYDIKYIPYEKGVPLLEAEIDYSVFPEIVAQKSAPFAFYTRMEIGVDTISGELAEIMECKIGEPVMILYRYFMDENGKIIGYGKKYIHSAYGRLKAESGYLNR